MPYSICCPELIDISCPYCLKLCHVSSPLILSRAIKSVALDCLRVVHFCGFYLSLLNANGSLVICFIESKECSHILKMCIFLSPLQLKYFGTKMKQTGNDYFRTKPGHTRFLPLHFIFCSIRSRINFKINDAPQQPFPFS